MVDNQRWTPSKDENTAIWICKWLFYIDNKEEHETVNTEKIEQCHISTIIVTGKFFIMYKREKLALYTHYLF